MAYIKAYVKREAILAQHRAFLDGMQERSIASRVPWLMIITGMECVGKSTVLDQIRDEQYIKQARYITLDFADSSLREDHFNVLDSIIEQVKDGCDQNAIARFEAELEKARITVSEIGKQKDNINVLIQAQGGSDVVDNHILISLDQRFKEMTIKLLDSLKRSFRRAICTLREDYLILLLDNFEWLIEHERSQKKNQEIDYWLLNTLLPNIHEDLARQTPGKQCFAIITTRITPSLDVIKQKWVLNLQPLSEEEAHEYFQQEKNRLPEDPSVYNMIQEKTHRHIHCMTIFCDAIGKYQHNEPADDILHTNEHVSMFYEEAWKNFVDSQILARLESPFKTLLQYGVIADCFTLQMWREVFKEDLPERQASDYFNTFIRYPCIQFNPQSYSYTIHPLIREIICEHAKSAKSEQWEQYEQCIREYSNRKGA